MQMNERLKNLYYKAHDTSDVEGSFPQYFSATKFAELIVKECAYLVNHQQRTTGYTTHAQMLCKEFGIEFKDEDYYGN